MNIKKKELTNIGQLNKKVEVFKKVEINTPTGGIVETKESLGLFWSNLQTSEKLFTDTLGRPTILQTHNFVFRYNSFFEFCKPEKIAIKYKGIFYYGVSVTPLKENWYIKVMASSFANVNDR